MKCIMGNFTHCKSFKGRVPKELVFLEDTFSEPVLSIDSGRVVHVL